MDTGFQELDEPEVREIDRRNGNTARARRQAAQAPRVTEDEAGNVHRQTATSLVIPEEKRCVATTLAGNRCKVGRMHGLTVCTFHSHLALSADALAHIADVDQKPRLSPRAALKHAVQMQADPLAQAAVRGALDSDGRSATSAVLALVDAVDPLVQQEASIDLTAEGVQTASLRQLRAVFGSTTPS